MKKKWTEDEIRTLCAMYPMNTAEAVAKALCRSASSVKNQAFSLKLKKAQGFFKALPHPVNSGSFKKGMQTWNKGVKGSTGLHENSRANHFKPGSRPKNTQDIGSLRFSKDGYLERKEASGWELVHRTVWIAEHGAIPDGHIVAFKNGRMTAVESEITIDKLECISRAEGMKRNSAQRFGPEMAAIYQLKGAIARQLNRIEKNDIATHHPSTPKPVGHARRPSQPR